MKSIAFNSATIVESRPWAECSKRSIWYYLDCHCESEFGSETEYGLLIKKTTRIKWKTIAICVRFIAAECFNKIGRSFPSAPRTASHFSGYLLSSDHFPSVHANGFRAVFFVLTSILMPFEYRLVSISLHMVFFWGSVVVKEKTSHRCRGFSGCRASDCKRRCIFVQVHDRIAANRCWDT